MWVLDAEGFTMACLAVRIRNLLVHRASMARPSGMMDATASNGPSQARISVATSWTDFTAPEADFTGAGQASTATFNASARISSTNRSFSLTNSGVVLTL